MAFSQFEFAPGNRAYVQTNNVRQPEINVGGFAGIGGIAKGIAGLAEAAGTVGSVIDNWGAGKRAEQAKNREAAMEWANTVHPDDLANYSPEEMERMAGVFGLDVDNFQGVLDASAHSLDEERRKTIAWKGLHDELNPDAIQQHINQVEPEGQEQGPPGEVPPQQEGQGGIEPAVAYANDTSQQIEDGMAHEGDPGAIELMESPYDDVLGASFTAEDMMRQAENHALITEAAAAPTTAGYWEEALAKENTPIPNPSPDPMQLDQVQKNASRSFLDYSKNQRIMSAYLLNELTNGRQPDMELATNMGMRLVASQAAFAEGLKGFMYQHFKYVPKEWQPFINDPSYFEDSITYNRYNFDAKFRQDMDAQDPGRIAEIRKRISTLPPHIREVWAPGIEKATKAQMESGLEYYKQDIEIEKNRITEKAEDNKMAIDLQKVGISRDQTDAQIRRWAVENGKTEADIKLEWAKHGKEVEELRTKLGIEKANTLVSVAQQRVAVSSAAIANRSAVQKMLAEVQSLQAPNSAAAMYLKIQELEGKVAIASQKASQKTGPSGQFAPLDDTDVSATEVTAAHKEVQAMKEAFAKQHGNAPFDVLLQQNGVVVTIDPTKDMISNMTQIAKAQGLSDAYIKSDLKAMDQAYRLLNVSPNSSSVVLPKGMGGYLDYVQSKTGLHHMEFPDFMRFLKTRNWHTRDPQGLYNYYLNRVATQGAQ